MIDVPKKHLIQIRVNGVLQSISIDATERLIDLLRDRLNLKGTKEGCGTGDCGACVVIVDGKAVPSCLLHAATLDGSEVTTIEGIGSHEHLHPLQETFVQLGAVQCGFCTPGIIMSAKSLLDSNLSPTRDQVREALVGNLCRCTGYSRIIDAVMMAAEKMRKPP